MRWDEGGREERAGREEIETETDVFYRISDLES